MLAIAGGAGGVGKTTTTLGLARALPGTPLVVDADRDMPNLHALADQPRASTPTLAEACARARAAGPTPVDGTALDLTDHQCRLLAAPRVGDPPTPRLLVRLDSERARGRSSGATGGDHRVLVDCPSGAAVDAAAPLGIVDGVVLVSTPAPAVLRDTAKTAAMARAYGTSVLGVVLTRTRTEAGVPTGPVSSLLDCPVLTTVPAVDPPVLADPAVAGAYDRAADRLRSPIPSGTGGVDGGGGPGETHPPAAGRATR